MNKQRDDGPRCIKRWQRTYHFAFKDPEAKSADLNVARQFLKDNGIDALPVEGSPLSDLVATLPDFSDDTFDVSELKLN